MTLHSLSLSIWYLISSFNHFNFFNIFNHNHIDFHSNRDVDDVHDMMDDISEQTELANEISDAISTSVGFGQDYDEVSLNFFVFVFFLC